MHVDKTVHEITRHPAVLCAGVSLEEFLVMAREFHGYLAPGLVIGGFMVSAAQSRLSPGVLYDAISETAYCLPDAVQLLTPCTIGNGWLKIADFGRYALCLYDKTSGEGVRVSVDSRLVKNRPRIREWFYIEKPKKEQDTDLLLQEILEAGTDYFDVREVMVDPEHRKPRRKGDIVDCSVCGEAYPVNHGVICRSCRGENPYAHYLPSIPAAAWSENDGTFANSERRVSRVRKASEPPGVAKPNWWIFKEIARRMGQNWASESAQELWDNEISVLAPNLGGIKYARIE